MEPLSMRVHHSLLAAINATMRSLNFESPGVVSDQQYAEATMTALIPLLEHAAKLINMPPSMLVAMVALSLAHEAAPATAQSEVTSIITKAQFDAIVMMKLAGTEQRAAD